MPERRNVQYNSAADAIADIASLRGGPFDRCGTWSLAQTCWHLNVATLSVMKGGEKMPNTPEQDAMRPFVGQLLASGKLPGAVPAPPQAVPPAAVPEGAIDDLIATLQKLDAFPGPFGTHRLFGNLPDDEIRRLALIHAAHHLSLLVPNSSSR